MFMSKTSKGRGGPVRAVRAEGGPNSQKQQKLKKFNSLSRVRFLLKSGLSISQLSTQSFANI